MVVKGYEFRIVSIRLVNSHLVFTAVCPGPVPAMQNEPVAIFGEDGQGFCQGEAAGGLTFGGAKAGEIVQAEVKLLMTHVE